MSNLFAIVRVGTAAAALGIFGAASDAATLQVPSQYATIQAAVDKAVSGDLVLVSAGTYSEHLLIQYKSIEVRGATGAKTTVVDGGSSGGSVVSITIPDGGKVTLVGLTLQHGFGSEGGGIFANGTIDVEHCIIQHNETIGFGGGGGMALSPAGASIVRMNRIGANTATLGAGLYVVAGSALIEGNVIDGNQGGSGLFVDGGAPVILRNVVRDNDDPDGSGAGMAFWIEGDGSPTVSENLVIKNNGGYGAGIYVVGRTATSAGSFVNNTVVGNVGYVSGPDGGYVPSQLYAEGLANHLVFANNIFSGYPAVGCGGKYKPQSPKFFHNDVDGRAYGSCAFTSTTGTNLVAPPQFTRGDDAHPYHLAPHSPLVDAGSNRHARGLHGDFEGNPRIVDGGDGRKADIGAYEYQPD